MNKDVLMFGPTFYFCRSFNTCDVTDYLLEMTFQTQYPSVREAMVVIDPKTGRSKGHGFVKFHGLKVVDTCMLFILQWIQFS